jgi:hypothetical protein
MQIVGGVSVIMLRRLHENEVHMEENTAKR